VRVIREEQEKSVKVYKEHKEGHAQIKIKLKPVL
jgi:hypothetical protein